MSHPPSSSTSAPSLDTFDYDSTDAEDDFQLIDPNRPTLLPTSTHPPSSPRPSYPSSNPSPPPLPLSQSTRSLPPRRRRRNPNPSLTHSTPSLPHRSTPSPPPPSDIWGLQSHMAVYYPASSPATAPIVSSLGSDWLGRVTESGGMDYEETEEMEEELSSEGFDDEGAHFPPSSSISIQRSFTRTLDEGEREEGRERMGEWKEEKEKKMEEVEVSSTSPPTSPTVSASTGSLYPPTSALTAQQFLPLYSAPTAFAYSPSQQAMTTPSSDPSQGSIPVPTSVASSNVSTPSSPFSTTVPASTSASAAFSASKAPSDTTPLPYFPWVSPLFLRRAGYAAVGLFVFYGLFRLGSYYFVGKTSAFQMMS